MLDSPKKNIRKEACWTISNITAGTSNQIQSVIDKQGIPKLIKILQAEEFEVQKEVAWAIANATSGGTSDQTIYLVHEGAVAGLCSLLSSEDSKMITVVLDGLENILKVGVQRPGPTCEHIKALFSQCGGLEAIEKLQDHIGTRIYQQALHILSTYFDVEEVKGNEHTSAISVQQSQNATILPIP
jgi:hypothetical protein